MASFDGLSRQFERHLRGCRGLDRLQRYDYRARNTRVPSKGEEGRRTLTRKKMLLRGGGRTSSSWCTDESNAKRRSSKSSHLIEFIPSRNKRRKSTIVDIILVAKASFETRRRKPETPPLVLAVSKGSITGRTAPPSDLSSTRRVVF